MTFILEHKDNEGLERAKGGGGLARFMRFLFLKAAASLHIFN